MSKAKQEVAYRRDGIKRRVSSIKMAVQSWKFCNDQSPGNQSAYIEGIVLAAKNRVKAQKKRRAK